MSNIGHIHSLFIKLSEHSDLILYVHPNSLPETQYKSLPSSGIGYKNFVWFAKESLSLGSVFGTVTWTWAGESRHCASISNTGKRFFSSAKCPHWFCGQSSFLFKENNRLCGLLVRVSGYRYRGPGFDPRLPDFLNSSGSGTGSTQPREPREVN